MAYTNKTPHYELPQWIATDKPSYLSDQNQAYLDIDTAIFEAKTAGDSAGSVANSALGAADTAQQAAAAAQEAAVAASTTAAEAKTSATQAITNATQAMTEATNAAGAASDAQTTADTAKTTAEAAQGAASAAAGSASTAQNRANEAYTLAQGASSTAQAAQTAAQAASGQVINELNGGTRYTLTVDPVRKIVSAKKSSSGVRGSGTNPSYSEQMIQITGNPFNLPSFGAGQNPPVLDPSKYNAQAVFIANSSLPLNSATSTNMRFSTGITEVRAGYGTERNLTVLSITFNSATEQYFYAHAEIAMSY